MAKVIFLDETKQEIREHEAKAEDAAELFRLANQLSDAELERMARTIDQFPPENPQNSAKI